MKRILFYAVLMCGLIITGCGSYKKVPYLQNSDEVDLTMATKLYDATIMPKDILNISVVCPLNPTATDEFNLTASASAEGAGASSYLVSNDGYINFPVLGKIKVVGMTKGDLEEYIAGRVYGTYLKERPLVTVAMAGFKISVLGEVGGPGQYTIPNGKVNVFEALALAGDMTVYGRRDNVKIIRESYMGEKEIVELNMNDANVINSPYYQLQQNDIVYVTPNKTKAKSSSIGADTNLWFSSVSIVFSIAALLYQILK